MKGSDQNGKINIIFKLFEQEYIPNEDYSNSNKSVNKLCNLNINIIEANNLKGYDHDGKSDPYCKIFIIDSFLFRYLTSTD